MRAPLVMPKLDCLSTLNCLADKGFGRDPVHEMQRIIDAEKSDLYDVLAYVAFAPPTETRAP
jgi:type I restriction enzyme R subunit